MNLDLWTSIRHLWYNMYFILYSKDTFWSGIGRKYLAEKQFKKLILCTLCQETFHHLIIIPAILTYLPEVLWRWLSFDSFSPFFQMVTIVPLAVQTVNESESTHSSLWSVWPRKIFMTLANNRKVNRSVILQRHIGYHWRWWSYSNEIWLYSLYICVLTHCMCRVGNYS